MLPGIQGGRCNLAVAMGTGKPRQARIVAVYALIAINIAAFAWMVMNLTDDATAFSQKYGLLADDWRWFQFFTANFMHADILHLLGNMLFLRHFGDSIDDVVGLLGLLSLYFIGGFLGDLLYVHDNVGTEIPTVGASGCISVIAGAYAIMSYDRAVNLRLMLFVLPLTFSVMAFWVVLFWLGADIWRTMVSSGTMDSAEGVSFVSHGIGCISGALFGVIARVHGVMQLYERLSEGGAWFGYRSDALGRRVRLASPRK
ncbi:MAG: rhomboid family intramembrane serine protease [Lysobacteraceae bacterium]